MWSGNIALKLHLLAGMMIELFRFDNGVALPKNGVINCDIPVGSIRVFAPRYFF